MMNEMIMPKTYTHQEVFNRIEFEISQMNCGKCEGDNKNCPFFTGNIDDYLDPECSKHIIYRALIQAKETPTLKKQNLTCNDYCNHCK